ncbi:MAG: DNA polymerase III subunit beta [Deltaproteobacteria bacterium]|nr:DNA polymerase III subunit beta [Deltaproteobacteria bacterium]
MKKDEVRKIRMVSTDGHRLSKIDYDVEEAKGVLKLEKSVIIPKSGIVEVLKLLEKGGTVKIGFKDSNFVVEKENELLIIRLIDGEFPDYEMVIPMVVQKEDFLMMLRRMSILSSDKYPGVRFKITKGQLEATTTNPEIGESKEAIALSYKGQPLEVAVNPRYFTETLNSMNSDEVVVRFKDEVNPCTMEGKEDPGFLSVIMPMRV